jgi:hypothetical protein
LAFPREDDTSYGTVQGVWRLDSPDRDGGLDIDIALDGIRVGTDGVGALDQLFRGLLVDPGYGDGERGREHEGI